MTGGSARSRKSAIPIVPLLGIGLGLAGVLMLSNWMDQHRPSMAPRVSEDRLYVTGAAAKRMSLAFNGLVADWYWMRSLQYVGEKIIASNQGINVDLRSLDLKLLAPLLDAASTLDPRFISVYEYGAIMLPAVSDSGSDQAIALLRKGIAANPTEWRLFHHLGYIYWQRGDYKEAAEVYHEASQLPGALRWLAAMSARMTAEGGSRGTARQMYQVILEGANDSETRKMAERRLQQLDSLDERDTIRQALTAYQSRTGRCPTSWRQVTGLLRTAGLRIDASTGAPLDPSGMAYELKSEPCNVDLGEKTEVLKK